MASFWAPFGSATLSVSGAGGIGGGSLSALPTGEGFMGDSEPLAGAASTMGEEDEDEDLQTTTFSIHYAFQAALAAHVHGLQVKDKRSIFATMRRPPPVQPDSFLPHFGMTVGEFSTFNVLAPGVRKSSSGAGAAKKTSGSVSASMSASAVTLSEDGDAMTDAAYTAPGGAPE